jgi:4-diphosphocytidyl-2-C-methyl-D-erythritol kinase
MNQARSAMGDAHAKVNMTLEILDRRPDGYHNIRSVMQTISLRDSIVIRRGVGHPGIALTVDGPAAEGVPSDQSNLVVRAVRSALSHAGIDPERESICVQLHKTIPAEAGLGGGSSDAATALLITNRLFDLGIARPDLVAIASTLGSDVPFFLTGGAARVEGVGERVTPLDKPSFAYQHSCLVLVKPAASISTAAAYRALDDARALSLGPLPSVPLTPALPGGERELGGEGYPASAWEAAYEYGINLPLHNDFQPVVFGLSNEIAEAHATLAVIGRAVGAPAEPAMTGSGSCLFLLVIDKQMAAKAVAAIEKIGLGDIYVAQPTRGGMGID